MTKPEIAVINRAIVLLRSLVDDPQVTHPESRPCPVRSFAEGYLVSDPQADLTCKELWTHYREIAQAGELPPLRKAVFLRRLPTVMESVYNVRKCHHIERSGRRVRGFQGVEIRGWREAEALAQRPHQVGVGA